ncbi:MAG: HEPN domain-containing protein [Candidatus Zixiibacteriota bacterium]
MSLQDWLKNKWLKSHKTSPEEVNQQFEMAERDLHDAGVSTISPDWRLAMAYNASLRYATTALNACGYRTSGEGHHERLIESLRHTINADLDLIEKLHRFRKKRHVSSYDMAGSVSEYEVEEAIKLAKELGRLVKGWLKKNHPELAKDI